MMMMIMIIIIIIIIKSVETSQGDKVTVGTPHSSSPSSVRSSQQRSLAAYFCVSLPKRPFGAPASENTSAGHA
jgi:hypothetical protein